MADKYTKEQRKLYNKNYRSKNAEKLKTLPDRYSKEKRKQYGFIYRFTKYGITEEEYNTLFSSQNGCCKICGIHQSNLDKSLFIDHCHKTNKVRGLLCFTCNSGLGLFKDNKILLLKASRYLGAVKTKEDAKI